MFQALADRGKERREAFADGAGVAGEIDDERVAARAGGGAGEDGGGNFGETDGAHGLAEAGEFAVEDVAGCLRRKVAWRGAGAAGGDDEVAAVVVAEGAQGGRDGGAIVGYEAGEESWRGINGGGEDALDLGAGGSG